MKSGFAVRPGGGTGSSGTRCVKGLAAALGAALVVGLWPGAAFGHDHRPPGVVMFTSSGKQQANTVTYTWAVKQGRFCSIEHADGFGPYPRAIGHNAGDEVRIRFKKRQRPTHVRIRKYRRVNRHGSPRGDGRNKDFDLVRIVRHGRPRWEARFDVVRLGHHYFDIQAEWEDVDGCGEQDGEWITHLKAS